MNKKQTVAIVDKSDIIRKGLTVLLNYFPQVQRVVEQDENAISNKRLPAYNPDIVIINPLLIGSAQKKTAREILEISKKTRLVALLYSYVDEQTLSQYDAVIRIDDPKEKIEESLKNLQKHEEDTENESCELTEREKEILISVAKGMINKEIAELHNISINTVITHRRNIARKLEINSPAGLTVYAILNKLINIEDLKM